MKNGGILTIKLFTLPNSTTLNKSPCPRLSYKYLITKTQDMHCLYDCITHHSMPRIRSLSDLNSSDSIDVSHIPFWFFDEDPHIVKAILQSYGEHMELKHHNRFTRAQLFVGRVKRVPLAGSPFRTLDTVYVYRRVPVSEGSTMPLEEQQKYVTEWDTDGLPATITQASTYPGIFKAENAPTSYLYGEPIFNCTGEYQYTAAWEERSVGYAGLLHCLWQHCPRNSEEYSDSNDEEKEQNEYSLFLSVINNNPLNMYSPF